MSTLATFVGKIDTRIKDAAAKLTTAEKQAAVAVALEEYSKARPQRKAELVDGTGAFDYALDGATPKLTLWKDQFSAISSIVYPWSATTAVLPVLDSDDYAILRLSTGLVLRFLTATPAAAEKFLAEYTTLHVVDVNSSTVPVADEEALSDLAACYVCETLAGFYSQATDGTFAADTVAHLSKAQEYRAQAKRWRDAYLAKLGGDSADAPASAVSAVASVFPTARRDAYFFHDGGR